MRNSATCTFFLHVLVPTHTHTHTHTCPAYSQLCPWGQATFPLLRHRQPDRLTSPESTFILIGFLLLSKFYLKALDRRKIRVLPENASITNSGVPKNSNLTWVLKS